MKTSFTTTAAAAAITLLAASPVCASDPLDRMLAARQTSADATDGPCMSSADAILSGAPLPTDQVLFSYFSDFFATAIESGAIPCKITDTPSSVSSAYLAYSSTLSSWSVAEYANALSFAEQGECRSSVNAAGEVLQVLTAVDIYLGKGCLGASGGASATPTPTITPAPGQSTAGSSTGGAAGATTAASTTAQPGAGARATQAPAVVLAVGAMAAAVAMV